MNTYKNYTYQKLADGIILANMPIVGDMIFKDESEFKAYIDGYLITQKFLCEGFIEDPSGMQWQACEDSIKERNATIAPTADSILLEKVAEAFNAYQHGDKKNALKEFAQVGVVVPRCMEFIQKEMVSET